MGRVASLPCCAVGCSSREVQVHHVRDNTGLGVRPCHYETIPLCLAHHTGAHGIHTIGKKTWEKKYGTQKEHLERIKSILAVDI